MTPILTIQSEILKFLDEWKEFVWELDLETNFGPGKKYTDKGGKFFKEERSEYAASVECLQTMDHMKQDSSKLSDPNDAATQEEEFRLELRTRDRERKLISKIDQALNRIDDGSYGYCEDTGEPI